MRSKERHKRVLMKKQTRGREALLLCHQSRHTAVSWVVNEGYHAS